MSDNHKVLYRSNTANKEVVEIFGLVLAVGRELKLPTVDIAHVLFVKAFNVAMCLRINTQMFKGPF